jgi:hypothetical protein
VDCIAPIRIRGVDIVVGMSIILNLVHRHIISIREDMDEVRWPETDMPMGRGSTGSVCE